MGRGHQGGETDIFKSDSECSIEVAKAALTHKFGRTVVMERHPKGESQSNGVAEEGGSQSGNL